VRVDVFSTEVESEHGIQKWRRGSKTSLKPQHSRSSKFNPLKWWGSDFFNFHGSSAMTEGSASKVRAESATLSYVSYDRHVASKEALIQCLSVSIEHCLCTRESDAYVYRHVCVQATSHFREKFVRTASSRRKPFDGRTARLRFRNSFDSSGLAHEAEGSSQSVSDSVSGVCGVRRQVKFASAPTKSASANSFVRSFRDFAHSPPMQDGK
jgi:hypothetical protein